MVDAFEDYAVLAATTHRELTTATAQLCFALAQTPPHPGEVEHWGMRCGYLAERFADHARQAMEQTGSGAGAAEGSAVDSGVGDGSGTAAGYGFGAGDGAGWGDVPGEGTGAGAGSDTRYFADDGGE